MANILDIFSTHTGERLLRRSVAICNIEKDKLHNAYILALPALLANLKTKDSIEKIDSQDLIHFIEEGNMLETGEKVLTHTFEQEQLEKLKSAAAIIKIEHENFEKILKLSSSFISALIHKIMDKDTNLEFSEVVKNLAGEESNLDSVFLDVLVKNSGSHGLIDSAEEIALKKGKNKSDDSSLGGYTGGR